MRLIRQLKVKIKMHFRFSWQETGKVSTAIITLHVESVWVKQRFRYVIAIL